MKLTQEQTDLVQQNMNLVYDIVHNDYRSHVKLYDDLEQEGFMGLCKASQIYDASKGAFSTIATPYINGYIKTYLIRKDPLNLKTNPIYFQDTVDYEDGRMSYEEIIGNEDMAFTKLLENSSTNTVIKKILELISEDDLKFLLQFNKYQKGKSRTKERLKEYRKYEKLMSRLRRYFNRYQIKETE
jgi:RNA polymerase sigma factor (sigma-70 family)